MDYKENNYILLKELSELLNAFPFNKEVEFHITSMDLNAIHQCYKPYADIENDEVANAICWSVDILKSLLEKSPVRTLDELLSFVAKVLNNRGE